MTHTRRIKLVAIVLYFTLDISAKWKAALMTIISHEGSCKSARYIIVGKLMKN